MDCISWLLPISGGKAENSSAVGKDTTVDETRRRRQSPGERWLDFKGLHLDWMEQLVVVPWGMAFRVWRSYSEKRQSTTYQLASAESAFECLVEAQECLAEF